MVPGRVVSLIPSATELIFAVGAGDKLVGVTINDAFPPEVLELPKVGDQTIDQEKLVSLSPDLVVFDSAFNSGVSGLKSLGLETLELNSQRLSDIPKNLRLLAHRLGVAQQGEDAAVEFESELSKFKTLDSPPRVFVEIWGSPLMTVGRDSLPNDLLDRLGMVNVYQDQVGYFQVDPEDVVSRRPDIVILPGADHSKASAALKLLRDAGIEASVLTVEGGLLTNPTTRVLEGLRILRQKVEDLNR